MTISHNPELWQSLPAEKQHKVEQRDNFRTVDDQLTRLSVADDKPNSSDQWDKLQAQKRKIIKVKLQRFQKEQPHLLLPGRVAETSHHCTLFSRISPLMPIRRRLADRLFTAAPICSEEGRAVLDDLVDLYKLKTDVVFRPGLEPAECCCCMEDDPYSRRSVQSWRHIYSCYNQNLRKKAGFTEFCFCAVSDATSRRSGQSIVKCISINLKHLPSAILQL